MNDPPIARFHCAGCFTVVPCRTKKQQFVYLFKRKREVDYQTKNIERVVNRIAELQKIEVFQPLPGYLTHYYHAVSGCQF